MGKQSNNRSRSRSRGYDRKGSSKTNKKKSGGAIPIEKLKFATGDNQAENFQRLKKHLAQEALGKFGASIAHILYDESEYTHDKPSLQLSKAQLSASPSEEEKAETAKQDRELELIFNSDQAEYNKKIEK